MRPPHAAAVPVPQDSLDRLADIKKIELAKADRAGWAARPAQERTDQEAFMAGQQKTARGFLRMAISCLSWLDTLTGERGGERRTERRDGKKRRGGGGESKGRLACFAGMHSPLWDPIGLGMKGFLSR